jgi:hypothetical protein
MARLARAAATALLAGLATCTGSADGTRADSDSPQVFTTDVHNFVTAFDAWTPADTGCSSLGQYLAAGSAGLAAYRAKMEMEAADLCHAVRHDTKRYAALKSKLPGIDSAQAMIADAFRKFRALVPDARLPAVYFVVGDEMSAGTTTHGRNPIVLVGAEMLGSLNGLPVLTVHEFVHAQQHYPAYKLLNAGPRFIRGTLLAQSIKEGSANFLAELTTGQIPSANVRAYGDAHEREIWRNFQHDMHDRQYSMWLYNGGNKKALGDRPTDLGYYVGYRITKSYYDRAIDKKAAIHDILSIHDFDDFLRKSAYAGNSALVN